MLAWLTFISATLAASFGGRRAVQGWLYARRDRREARRAEMAGWSQAGVDTWRVHMASPPGPPERTAMVTVMACGRDGEPDPDQAGRLRRYLEENNCLSRNPTPAELETLEQAGKAGGRLAIRRARRGRLVT